MIAFLTNNYRSAVDYVHNNYEVVAFNRTQMRGTFRREGDDHLFMIAVGEHSLRGRILTGYLVIPGEFVPPRLVEVAQMQLKQRRRFSATP